MQSWTTLSSIASLEAALLDTAVVVVCFIFLYRFGRVTSVHPGLAYLLFHVMFFTTRLYAVAGGAPTLFTSWPGALPVSDTEIAVAGILADVGLVGMTVGCIFCSRRNRNRGLQASNGIRINKSMLSEKVVIAVCAVALPIGIISLLVAGAIPSAEHMFVDFGEWNTSSWLMATRFWPVLVILVLIYVYGFKLKFTVPLVCFLILMSIQGYDRFRVVLPIIFILTTWQMRTGRKWPRSWMVIGLLFLTMITFPMKELGRMIRLGQPVSDMIDVTSQSFSEASKGRAPDQMFLDMFASMVWLVDKHSTYFYGSTVLPLVYLPVPRQLWPEKPSLVEYLKDIRNPARPMYWAGMAPMLLGEAYANFGLLGIAGITVLLGYLLTSFYFAALSCPYFAVLRFIYLTVLCSLVQVFRDGLASIVVFPVVGMMPFCIIGLLSYSIYAVRKKSARSAAGLPTRPAPEPFTTFHHRPSQ
jgi:oligosaccharide repeat unit polymerase